MRALAESAPQEPEGHHLPPRAPFEIFEAARDRTPAPTDDRPHIVILGAGFAGLACAKQLGDHPVRVTIVDRTNYHLFVPLLYQVATAALSPADIAEPIRKILRRFRNIDVVMAEAVGLDLARRRLALAGGDFIGFDRLVLAAGSDYNYFGHEAWRARAPGLKTLGSAREIRARILAGFERAETEHDPVLQQKLTTTIVVGGGPTGVETAGAVAELARHALARDFRNIDPASAHVLLLEAGPRLLSSFPPTLGEYARRRLAKLRVTVATETAVSDVCDGYVRTASGTIPAQTIIWCAGITPSPSAGWLRVPKDATGRIVVEPDLSVRDAPSVYCIGDLASFSDGSRHPLPALAQVAKQQGEHLGRNLAAALDRHAPMAPFRFRDRGNAAIIGRSAAVFDFGRWQLTGWLAWVLWSLVHIWLLVGFQKRLLVSVEWFWRWLTYEHGARIIPETSPRETGSDVD